MYKQSRHELIEWQKLKPAPAPVQPAENKKSTSEHACRIILNFLIYQKATFPQHLIACYLSRKPIFLCMPDMEKAIPKDHKFGYLFEEQGCNCNKTLVKLSAQGGFGLVKQNDQLSIMDIIFRNGNRADYIFGPFAWMVFVCVCS